MKKFIRASIFIICFFCLFNFIFTYLSFGKNALYYFYKEPKNSLDVAYIGASNAYVHYNPLIAYKKYGYTTGLLSTPSQPFSAIKYMLIEAKKYQNSKLYIIDISNIAKTNPDEGEIRVVTDIMKFSKNRFDAIKNILSYSDISKDDYLSYYLPFFKYHNSWKSIKKESIYNEDLFKGNMLNKEFSSIKPQETFIWNSEEKELPKNMKKILDDLIDYINNTCEAKEILFIISPHIYKNKTMGYLNKATKILQDHNLKVINFNIIDDLKLDYKKDFHDKEHLNTFGTIKFTKYFSEYLSQKYNLPDHRGDKKYSSWEKEYQRYTEKYKEITGKDFVLK